VKNEFGVLSIAGKQYTRSCCACGFMQTYPFWSELKKSVIYVDQFAISNMMKAIDVAAKAHNRALADPFWLTLFESLERICKLQLAICPESHQHRVESVVSRFYERLKRMNEQLSYGVTFDSHIQIEQQQTDVALLSWLEGKQPAYDFNPERVTSGGLDDWQGRLIVSVSSCYRPERVDAIRRDRDRHHAALAEWFEQCRARIQKSFQYAFNIERDGCRDGLLRSGCGWIHDVLKAHGVNDAEVGDQTLAFLNSDIFRDTPFNRISTRLFAMIAYRAANGQKRPLGRGISNDIDVVSSLMPYCDAMFIDNECRGLLSNIPKKYALGYTTRIFSRSNGDEFLDYIKSIEAAADPTILREVRAVYGDDWLIPFLRMYEVEREMKQGHRQRSVPGKPGN
jgi:hypothetical protein